MNKSQALQLVQQLESELEIAQKQSREIKLSQDSPSNSSNPFENAPQAQNSLSPIPRQGEEEENASPVILRGNSRKLARDRHERQMSALMLAVSLAGEIERIIVEGRIPWNVGLMAVGVVLDELEEKLAAESLSWADSETPAYANFRARLFMDDHDENG